MKNESAANRILTGSIYMYASFKASLAYTII